MQDTITTVSVKTAEIEYYINKETSEVVVSVNGLARMLCLDTSTVRAYLGLSNSCRRVKPILPESYVDVLSDSQIFSRGQPIKAIRGNAAAILIDYLAFHKGCLKARSVLKAFQEENILEFCSLEAEAVVRTKKSKGRPPCASKRMGSGWIYLIVCDHTNMCKIGFSKNPEARLKELQTANPYPLQLHGSIPGSFNKEKTLHQKFLHLRESGEWFVLSNEIVAEFVASYDQPWIDYCSDEVVAKIEDWYPHPFETGSSYSRFTPGRFPWEKSFILTKETELDFFQESPSHEKSYLGLPEETRQNLTSEVLTLCALVKSSEGRQDFEERWAFSKGFDQKELF